jgi:hypothetical protein
MTELAIDIESDDASAARDLESSLRDALSLRIPVVVVPPGSLPRFEMKAKRWVRS